MKIKKQKQEFLDDLQNPENKNNQVDEEDEDGEGDEEDGAQFFQKRKTARSLLLKRDIFKIETKVSAQYYYFKHLFGYANEDSDDEEYGEDYCGKENMKKLQQCKGVNMKKQLKIEIIKELAPKLDDSAVFFTLIKGFIGSGILFLPNGFSNAGWGFSTCALLGSMWLTLQSILLLLKVSEKYDGSFCELGELALGKWGKITCDLTLALSQAGMTCSGVVFICQNAKFLLNQIFDIDVSIFYLGIICFCILAPMVWVKRLQVFAQFHLAADIIIVFALIVIMSYSTSNIIENKGFSNDLEVINTHTYLSFIGTSIFAYEGIGVILPVKDTCKDTKNFSFIVILVLIVCSILYLVFGAFNYVSYGAAILKEAPLITKALPQNARIVQAAVSLYICSSFISYPLILHPANLVVESYLFPHKSGIKHSRVFRNMSRTILVACTITLALSLEESLDKLMSVVGSVTCTPVAFILPTAFHLQLIATTWKEKTLDWFIIIVSTFIMIFLTAFTFVTWND